MLWKQHNQNGRWIQRLAQRAALVITCTCNQDHHNLHRVQIPNISTRQGQQSQMWDLRDCLVVFWLMCEPVPWATAEKMHEMKMKAPGGAGSTRRRRQGLRGRFSLRLLPIFLPFFMVTPALSIHLESLGSHSEFSCEPIRLRMCQDLPYNTTFMPNLLNHYDQQTAALAMEVGWLSHCHIFFFFMCLWVNNTSHICQIDSTEKDWSILNNDE